MGEGGACLCDQYMVAMCQTLLYAHTKQNPHLLYILYTQKIMKYILKRRLAMGSPLSCLPVYSSFPGGGGEGVGKGGEGEGGGGRMEEVGGGVHSK